MAASSANENQDKRNLAGELAARLRPFGFDIVHPFDVAEYNHAIRYHERLKPLDLFGRRRALGLLIAHTRALWDPFVAAYKREETLRESAHPLDAYSEDVIQNAVKGESCPHHVHFGHRRQEPFVSMLHFAESSGLARISPARLAAHPEHGFWFGLRAVITFDCDPPPELAPSADPCTPCSAPCKAALEKALHDIPRAESNAHWKLWIAVRESCPLGRDSRYSEDQVSYHHSKDRAFIR